MMKKILVLIISLILISSTLLNFATATYLSAVPVPAPSGDNYCNQKCGERCKEKGKASRCMKYCMMCCGKCKCVPSGIFGNKDECPCYRDWTSPNGRPKCP